ncbi:ANTAR domain-containing protein [Streptomyces xanthochromogenes]|uniref:ANTAR domain-containing protein n=1 Tax=Streptomyces xanthochromogenes TaxID=67384 RepID=UPI00378D47BB
MPRCDQDGAGQAGACTRLAAFTGAHQLSGLTVFSRPDGDRTVVSVCGELDLEADHQLLHVLRPDCPAPDATGPAGEAGRPAVGGVGFCDCSGVDLLLVIRREGLGPDGLAPDHAENSSSRHPGEAEPDEDLRRELDQLRRAMRSRGTIDLARGILMAAFGLSPDDAWQALVSTSQHTNTKLRCLAEQVVESAGGTPLPESVRRQLSAAVAEATAPAESQR